MRRALALAAIVAATVALGCAARQPEQSEQLATSPEVAGQMPARPLPFKGHQDSGAPADLPPAVAASLSTDSPVTFSYREELTHDEYHIPLIITALDPVTYVGAPLGDLGVTASASLWITEGGHTLGDYTAKAHVSKYYTLYSQPTHKELEDAARAAVREKIDQKLYRDANRLAAAVAAYQEPSNSANTK